jgi:hypothetical protein
VVEVGLNMFGLVHGLASLELRSLLGDERTAEGIWRQSLKAALTGLRQPAERLSRRSATRSR